jgi:hypothetical protein
MPAQPSAKPSARSRPANIGYTVRVPAQIMSPYYVALLGSGIGVDSIEAFIGSMRIGSKLAEAMRTLQLGEAIAFRGGRSTIVIARQLQGHAVICRLFRLKSLDVSNPLEMS